MRLYFQANDDFRREVETEAPKAEVYPGNLGTVVREDPVNGRVISTMRWGFPTKAPRKRAPKEGQSPWVYTWWTNVRNITGPKSGMWKKWLEQPAHRCLVPFDRFAEPKAPELRSPGDSNWWFTIADQAIPCFAGLWKTDPDWGEVYAFLTTEPNALVAPKHEKAMPVILMPQDHYRWLHGTFEDVLDLQAAYPSQLMAVT